MDNRILNDIINEIKSIIQSLNDAILLCSENRSDEKINTLFFDGMVKRFENLFLRVTKLLGLALSKEGIETLSPRGAIQEAVRLNWIKDPDFWLLAMDARSASMNSADNYSRQEFLNIASQFATEVEVITNLLIGLTE